MKILLIVYFILMIVILPACTHQDNSNDEKGTLQMRTVERDYDEIPWGSDGIGIFTDRLNLSPEAVVELAKLVVKESAPNLLEGRSVSGLTKIRNHNIIVVYFGMDAPESSPPMTGGGFAVAIDTRTAQVLQMWAEE